MEPRSTRDIEILFNGSPHGRSNLEVVGSNPTGAKFSLAPGDSHISFKRVATQGDLAFRHYCLLPAP